MPAETTVLNYTSDQHLIQMCQSEVVTREVAHRKKEINAVWEAFAPQQKEIAKYLPRLADVTEEEFIWALMCTESRCFEGVFVPGLNFIVFAEYFNHDTESNIKFAVTPARSPFMNPFGSIDSVFYGEDLKTYVPNTENNGDLHYELDKNITWNYKTTNVDLPQVQEEKLEEEKEVEPWDLNDDKIFFNFIFNEDTPKKAGEQICINYGHFSNKYLLMEYGFSLENNKYDYFRLDLSLEECSNVANENKSTNLEKIHMKPNIRVDLKATALHKDLLLYLRSIYEDKSDALILTPQSKEVEIKILKETADIANKQLSKMETTLEEDNALLAKSKKWIETFIIIFRIGQKKILHAQIEMANALISALTLENRNFPEYAAKPMKAYIRQLQQL